MNVSPTSVFGKESSKRAFLQEPVGIVFLGEFWLRPVVDALVVPGLGLVVLHSNIFVMRPKTLDR
jgi:hypothetical protein